MQAVRGRADKKTQAAPYLPIFMKELLRDVAKYRRDDGYSYVAKAIVFQAWADPMIVHRLSGYFWRTLIRGHQTWPGHYECEDIHRLIDFPWDRTERIKLRFTREELYQLDDVVNAIAKGLQPAVTALLVLGITDPRIVQGVAPGFAARSRYSI